MFVLPTVNLTRDFFVQKLQKKHMKDLGQLFLTGGASSNLQGVRSFSCSTTRKALSEMRTFLTLRQC